MLLDESGLKGIRKDFGTLDKVIRGLGFDRWSWDYDKAVYDLKLEDPEKGTVYYLRIPAEVIQGRLENPKTTVELGIRYSAVTFTPMVWTTKRQFRNPWRKR